MPSLIYHRLVKCLLVLAVCGFSVASEPDRDKGDTADKTLDARLLKARVFLMAAGTELSAYVPLASGDDRLVAEGGARRCAEFAQRLSQATDENVDTYRKRIAQARVDASDVERKLLALVDNSQGEARDHLKQAISKLHKAGEEMAAFADRAQDKAPAEKTPGITPSDR